MIEGGEFLTNNFGTAPGMLYEQNGKMFILLPGPPLENQPMIRDYLFPKLKEKDFIQGSFHTKVYRLYNVGESMVADLFVSFNENVDIGYYFTAGGWCEIHLSKYRTATGKKQIQELTVATERAEKILKDANIFFTEDKDISQLVLEVLTEKNLSVSFAESITGGNLSGEFVKNPGASKAFLGSVVSYSDDTKRNILGVSKESLDKYGAVSEQVVKEMVFGLKKITGSDIAVSVSGIAGPEGGTMEKPVGLICFGFLFGNDFYSQKEIFAGVRTRVMNRTVNRVFVEILKHLTKKL